MIARLAVYCGLGLALLIAQQPMQKKGAAPAPPVKPTAAELQLIQSKVEEFTAAFVNAATGNFTLVAGTPFRTGASDGGALGADVAGVNSLAQDLPR